LVVVGTKRTIGDTYVAGNDHESRIRMGSRFAYEQHRGHQPFYRAAIPYLYYNRLSVDSY
jgi:hypothetical protein